MSKITFSVVWKDYLNTMFQKFRFIGEDDEEAKHKGIHLISQR
jgi:hypothetical protein